MDKRNAVNRRNTIDRRRAADRRSATDRRDDRVEGPAIGSRNITVQLLEDIGAAFNRHDIDAIIRFFAEDGEFDNAVGPNIHGQRHVGKTGLRRFFSELMEALPDIQWHAIDNRVAGNKGYSQWRRRATLPDGTVQDWLGHDIFTFQDGLIIKKDTYFKIVE
jgi:ketosteroid isomerase-like protein